MRAENPRPSGRGEVKAQLYGLDKPPSGPQFRVLAEPWRPFRTWAVVLIRAAANRILGRDLAAPAPAG